LATVGERRFAPVAASVSGARRFVADVLTDLPGDLVEEVQLIVSELATNCVLHARTEFGLRIERSRDTVRVEVADRSPAVPVLHPPSEDDDRGRGLLIADVLSADWGVEQQGGAGKLVWFSLPVRPDGPGTAPERNPS
jgi:anti-sigma regulatory factor (Ser/Thr protein kinase)